MRQRWIVPSAAREWAVFLDVDGTLLEFAPTPQAVQVSPGLAPLLERIRLHCGGALALVSGRAIADLDALFRPYRFPAAGIHGIERRDAQGRMHSSGLSPEDLEPARRRLRRLVAARPGLLLEDKGRALALHFRNAPQWADEATAVMEDVRARLPVAARLQPGHCVIELRSSAAHKGTAIAQFMREPPFIRRVPLFLGDDVTDEDGFTWVESAGGQAIFVGPKPTHGRGWLPDPAAVRQWLATLAA